MSSSNQGSSSRQAASGSSREREGGVSRKRTGSSNHRDDAKMIGQWRIGRTIGKGSSGRVKIAKHAITGKYAAIKIVPKGLILTSRMSMSEAGAKADKVMLGIEREIVIMKLIDHPNVLNLFDVWETSSELYLIMEYVPGGELFDYLVKRGRLPISEALHYFQQIIHAVDYCHRFNICHRDLKPENLLLDKDKNIKVADFGMAAWEAGERMLETSCGSPHYASPEIVAGKAYHGSSSDIWSCGIILFALLTGRLPFDDDNIRSLLQKVKIGIFEMPDEIKEPARSLLTRMLEKDPVKRITMPEILAHPFFTSRPIRPIPGRQFVSPPSLDEVERPVNSPEEIDSDIMGNLKTLWSGAADDEIIAALMSKEKTWEKAIYHLLIKYRNKHLENYNMDDEEDEEARARRHARREREGRSAPSPAKRKGGAPQPMERPRLTPLGENETLQDRAPSPDAARPQAPTPKKAAGPQRVETMDVTPNKLAPPKGPRPALVTRGSSYAPSESGQNTSTPSIVLQEATPTKDLILSSPPVLGSPLSPRPRSMGEAASPSMIPQSGSPLNVPLVHDEQLQHFFNEVANQLNTMNIRSSIVSNASSTNSAAMASDYNAYLAYANTLPTVSDHDGDATETVDPNQFADADDDETEMASEYSHAPSTIHHHSMPPMSAQQSPLVGLGFGHPPAQHGARPGLYPMNSANTANTNRWSYASSNASSSRHPVEAASPLPMYSPNFVSSGPTPWSSNASAQEHHGQVMQAQRAAPPPPPSAMRQQPTRAAPPPPLTSANTGSAGSRRKPVQQVESLLPRDTSYVVIDNADVPASDSSWGSKQSGFSAHRNQDAFGMLKKKKKVTIDPVPYSRDLAGPSTGTSTFSSASSVGGVGPSPKRSWFNNLFSFKPPSCTLLSMDNVANTRENTRKALTDLGVRVAVVEIDGMRGLKCRLEEVRDAQGNLTGAKGVRFKVEFTRSTPNASGGHNTLVSLTQEKGAQSSFKHVFDQLKSVIEQNGPPRRTLASSNPTTPTSATFGIGIHARPSTQQAYAYQNNSRLSPVTMTHQIGATSPRPGPPVRWASSAPSTPVLPPQSRFTTPQIPQTSQMASPIRM